MKDYIKMTWNKSNEQIPVLISVGDTITIKAIYRQETICEVVNIELIKDVYTIKAKVITCRKG